MGDDGRVGLAEQPRDSVAGAGVVPQRPGGAGSIEDVAAAAFDTLLGRFGASRAGLALTVPGGRQLRFISSDATRDGGEARWCLIDAYAELPLNDAVRTGRDVVLATRESLMAAYPELGSKQQPTTRSVLALALQQAGRRIGGLVVYLDEEVDWPRLCPRWQPRSATPSSPRAGAGAPTTARPRVTGFRPTRPPRVSRDGSSSGPSAAGASPRT
jgi:hypothetical protein